MEIDGDPPPPEHPSDLKCFQERDVHRSTQSLIIITIVIILSSIEHNSGMTSALFTNYTCYSKLGGFLSETLVSNNMKLQKTIFMYMYTYIYI